MYITTSLKHQITIRKVLVQYQGAPKVEQVADKLDGVADQLSRRGA